jgi:t-SNARE complex subunit (syntaxin)
VQDEGLDQIGQAARRLKNVGQIIGDELDDQNVMLDDLHTGMDNTHRRLTRETEHVVHVTEKAKAGGMFCCIVLLILAIIVVAAVP